MTVPPPTASFGARLRRARERGLRRTTASLLRARLDLWLWRGRLTPIAVAAIRARLATGPGPKSSEGPPLTVITAEYKALNQQMHRAREAYGVQGKYHIGQVRLIAKIVSDDILDYGCGKRLLEAGLGFPIHNYDPGLPEFDQRPEPADVVVCLDVLEHIEPDRLDDVLADLARVTRRVGYFTVSTVPATKSLPDGRNAHLIVQPKEWWRSRVERTFRILLATASDDHVTFVVRPRA